MIKNHLPFCALKYLHQLRSKLKVLLFESFTLKSNLKLFYFTGTAFTSMPQLKYLDISYNHLPIVKKGAFKGGLISEGILKKVLIGGKIQMAKLVNSHLVYVLEDLKLS